MKSRAVVGFVMAIVMTSVRGVAAREPFEHEWHEPEPPAVPTPDPAPLVVPEGLYYVTDTYVADVVTTSDLTTTYSTTTVHESTGSYARVLDTVGTGAGSAFDGMAFNGRGALTDGRALAGTYYENFVLTSSGYVPVSIVFFQDDAETRRLAESGTRARPAATQPPAPAATQSPSPVVTGTTAAQQSPRPDDVAIRPIPTLRAGVALAPDGPVLGSAEILRGRVVRFWPRVFADGAPVPIRSWRLLSPPDWISAQTGGVEPLSAQWLRMPEAGAIWRLRFEVFSEVAPSTRLEAEIAISVWSPALVD